MTVGRSVTAQRACTQMIVIYRKRACADRTALRHEIKHEKFIFRITQFLTESQFAYGLTAEHLGPRRVKHLAVMPYVFLEKTIHLITAVRSGTQRTDVFHRYPVNIYGISAKQHILPGNILNHGGKSPRRKRIIRINEHHICPLSDVKAGIACGADTRIRLVQSTETR